MDINHQAAVGGFWVKDDGTTVLVHDRCGHSYALNRECVWGLAYLDAYKLGWVRISTCCDDDKELAVTFHETATVAALRTAAAIVRHFAQHRPHARYMGELRVIADTKYGETEDTKEVFSPEGASPDFVARKLASWLMQFAFAKNAADKSQQQEAA